MFDDVCACAGRWPSDLCYEDGKQACDCTVHHVAVSPLTEKGGAPIEVESEGVEHRNTGLAAWQELGLRFGRNRAAQRVPTKEGQE